MTKTRRVLGLMVASGKPLAAEDIAAAMGWSVSAARGFMRTLLSQGYIDAEPRMFAVTEQGAKWQKHAPKTPREELKKKYAQRVAKRRQRADWESSEEGRETLLLTRSIPTSVFQLGAM